jgi:hypothetical protein
MRACEFSDKESKDARKQMAVHRADSNATTNQQRDQQKWADSNGSSDDGDAAARQ